MLGLTEETMATTTRSLNQTVYSTTGFIDDVTVTTIGCHYTGDTDSRPNLCGYEKEAHPGKKGKTHKHPGDRIQLLALSKGGRMSLNQKTHTY